MGKTHDYVIANQSADWCGNPFSPCHAVHYTLLLGKRIPTPVTSVTGSE